MSDVISFSESNKKKKEKVVRIDPETKKQALEAKEKFEKFRKLCDLELYKECVDFIKDEIYEGLSWTPKDDDWWLKYSWGLKTFIKRVEGHAKKYDEAVKYLSEN